jgi:hypothetical protein
MRAYGGVGVQINPRFLNVSTSSALASRPGRFMTWKEPSIPIGWVAGWTPELVWTIRRSENSLPFPGLELRLLTRPVRSQSLYRLSYRNFYIHLNTIIRVSTPWLLVRKRTIPTERQRSCRRILVPTFVDRGALRDQRGGTPTAVNLFSRPEPLLFFQAAPHLSWRSWMDPIPDSQLFKQCRSAGNRTRDLRVCNQELWPLDHYMHAYKLFIGTYFKLIVCFRLKFNDIS